MSQAHVGMVIETLLTDENLRIRFAFERIETIADLCVRGVELTGDEIDLFCQTDPLLWFVGVEVKREWRQWANARVRFALSGRRPIRRSREKPSLRERWTKSSRCSRSARRVAHKHDRKYGLEEAAYD